MGAEAGASPVAPRYIVVLDDDVHDPGATARAHRDRFGVRVRRVYRHALKGYAAAIPMEELDSVRSDARVSYVERDRRVRASGQTLPWGIDRIDADISSTRAGDGSGAISNVNAYVIDTGVEKTQGDLDVVAHVNLAGGANADCNGHGTHVAGTIAGRDNAIDVVGPAAGAKVTGIKVLNCDGLGSTSALIKGIDWVTGKGKRPAVANLSLVSSPSQALDDAVRKSVARGFLYAVAAGNYGADACGYSPARLGTQDGVVTTAASSEADGEPSWSNFGPCVDLWAPGVDVISTRIGGGLAMMSGTSMAAPHVAGTAALYLSRSTGSSPATAEAALKARSLTTGTTSKDGRAIRVVGAGGF